MRGSSLFLNRSSSTAGSSSSNSALSFWKRDASAICDQEIALPTVSIEDPKIIALLPNKCLSTDAEHHTASMALRTAPRQPRMSPASAAMAPKGQPLFVLPLRSISFSRNSTCPGRKYLPCSQCSKTVSVGLPVHMESVGRCTCAILTDSNGIAPRHVELQMDRLAPVRPASHPQLQSSATSYGGGTASPVSTAGLHVSHWFDSCQQPRQPCLVGIHQCLLSRDRVHYMLDDCHACMRTWL